MLVGVKVLVGVGKVVGTGGGGFVGGENEGAVAERFEGMLERLLKLDPRFPPRERLARLPEDDILASGSEPI